MNRELIAREGMILTNGTIYGRIIYVADDVDINSFYEITEEEYIEKEEQIEDVLY